MILQASYTGVDGSNCIVFTTLHWRTQIFSDKATILEGIMASPTYTPEKHQNRTIMQDSERVKSHHWPISRVDDITMILLCYGWYQQAIIKMSSRKTITPESVKRKSQRQRTNHCNYLLWGIFTCEIERVLRRTPCLSSSSFFLTVLILKGYVWGLRELLPDYSACRISQTKVPFSRKRKKISQISLIGRNNTGSQNTENDIPPLHHYSLFSRLALSPRSRLHCETNQWVFCHILQLGWINSGILRLVYAEKRKETDTAERFSSSLTLASTGRGMNMINRAIYTREALCLLLKHCIDVQSSYYLFCEQKRVCDAFKAKPSFREKIYMYNVTVFSNIKAQFQIFTLTRYRSQPYLETKSFLCSGFTVHPRAEQRKSEKYIFYNDGIVNEPVCDCGSVMAMAMGSSPIALLLPWVFLHTKWERQAQRRRGNGAAWALLYAG